MKRFSVFLFPVLCALSVAAQSREQRAVSSPPFAVWSVSAGQSNAHFGISAASAGDVNGDGFADIVVGSPLYTRTELEEGAAFVYYGSAAVLPAQPDWTAYGGQRYADFGHSVAAAGDVNKDGFDDVLVGASGYTFQRGRYNVGAVFLYLGSSNGLSTNRAWTTEGPLPGGTFGYSVAGAGDINGDGFPDLIVGAPKYPENKEQLGKIFVFYGSDRGFNATADWTHAGSQHRARFGQRVAGVGDINGDGFADVIVSACDQDVNGVERAGQVFVFHGSRTGLKSDPDWTFEGRHRFGRLGIQCGGAGDVNRDGFDDVIVGAFHESHGDEKEGAAYVFYGSRKGLGDPDWFVESNHGGAGLGQGVGAAGDVNGDGFPDIIIGAPGFNGKHRDEGRAFVFHGSPAGVQTNFAWAAAEGGFRFALGRTVTSAGDVNGDGFADVLVGALMESISPEGGRIFVYPGSKAGLLPNKRNVNAFLISARQMRPTVPPLWRQTWFRASAAIVLVFVGWGCWHLIAIARLKRALRHVQHQRTLELERLRIAQDLHDQLGSSLTTITLLSEVARRNLHVPEKAEGHLNHITGTARSLTRALEEIVWAVNPRKDRLDQLVSYFSAYAEEFLQPTELRCRLDFPDELPELAVSSELRHELFLVFKEALTNVVKHAAAGEVRIRMALHERQLALTIEDDGCGFDPAATGFERNGITNMRSRIEKLGGTCEISSEPGKGSRVHVEASLEDAAATK